MKYYSAFLLVAIVYGAPPVLTELQPRGAQKGRPFTLIVSGSGLSEGATVVSTLPATFTPVGLEKTEMPNRSAAFLVEPTSDWLVGVYPIRVKAANGLSNILLFAVGSFPEIAEEESRPGSLPHQNDSIERAQTLPSTPLTLNGILKGPERDVFRIHISANERRVFEIEARRCGSAIDPVIRILDGYGKLIAQSEDDPVLSLDARVAVTFAKEGFYYVEVHDARFSTQVQDFYRLKTGLYDYVSEIFPLGGRRGDQVEVALGATKIKADLTDVRGPQIFVNLPNSPTLPLPFAVGEYPEVSEPVGAPLQSPVTVNGRLAKPLEVDAYELDVQPSDQFLFTLQARELGTSKIMGLITVYDEKGKKLASAGDGPLPVDVAAVQVSSRTQGDPNLTFKVPPDIHKIKVTVEDLAQRGGPHYGYRLSVQRAAIDLKATIVTPLINVPAGGTALVNVNVERRGYMGPVQIEAVNAPKGITVLGGDIPPEIPDPNNRATSRRAMLSFTAAADTNPDMPAIVLQAVAATDSGAKFTSKALGPGFAIPVAGATDQGVVDRQRPLTGPWLGLDLPVALTDATPATLGLTLESSERKESGYEFRFRWKWDVKSSMPRVPEEVTADVPNFIDLRVIGMAVDPTEKTTGTFLVTSTRNTLPALYNILITGRLTFNGAPLEVVSPIVSFAVPALDFEEKSANAPALVAR